MYDTYVQDAFNIYIQFTDSNIRFINAYQYLLSIGLIYFNVPKYMYVVE